MLVGAAYAALNLVLEPLQAFPEVALIYPPSALGVVAGVLWPVESAIGIFAATLLTPWGPTPFALLLLFAAGNSVEAFLPGVMLRGRGGEAPSVGALLLWGCLANTGANFVLARVVPSLVGPGGWEVQGGVAHLSWWLADVVTIVAFALPVLLLLRPGLFGETAPGRSIRALMHRRVTLTALLAVVAVSVAVFVSDSLGTLSFGWPAVLYLIPIGLMTVEGALPGALAANAVTAFSYLTVLGFESLLLPAPPLLDPQRMLVAHANLLVMGAFALSGGVLRNRNLRLHQEVENRWRELRASFDGLVRALAAAIEARDPLTERHVDRVAREAERLARRLGCSEEECEIIRWGAILHDVGKIGVPDSILFKPGPLTPEEQETMEGHLDLGAQILERAGVLPAAVPLIRYHEERWDGARDGRHPSRFGLKGEEIPLGARIIAVVDAFDAMTTDRPYRKALDPREAAEEIRREAGKQFDPEVAAAYLEMLLEASDSPG